MVVLYQQKSQKSLCVSNQSKIANYRYCRNQKQCTTEDLMSSTALIDTIEQVKNNIKHRTHKNQELQYIPKLQKQN